MKKHTGSKSVRLKITRNNKTVKDKEKTVLMSALDVPPGYAVAMIRDVVSLKLSHGFNSCGIEVGIEMPYPVRPGNLKDARAGFREVERMLEKAVEKKAAEVKQLLKDLSPEKTRKTR